MNFLERVRTRSRRGQASPAGSNGASSEGADGLPIPGYDRLDGRQVGARLSKLSQIQLGAVETYERSHQARPQVLDKLRYMRGIEPLPGYDETSPERIVEMLARADTETVKAIRDYERKFRRREQVMAEAARVLPTAQVSARERDAREGRATRVREGIAGRTKTADGLASRQSTPSGGN
jgi:hypothetical protein